MDPWPCSVGKGSSVAVSCGVGHKCGLDPEWLWLWCRPAAAAPIQPLASELPYAVGAGQKRKERKTKEKESDVEDIVAT